jgi:hypothetical protein
MEHEERKQGNQLTAAASAKKNGLLNKFLTVRFWQKSNGDAHVPRLSNRTHPSSSILFVNRFHLQKTYHMIDTCNPDIATWADGGHSFVIQDVKEFSKVSFANVW